jgi:hypothetical protein
MRKMLGVVLLVVSGAGQAELFDRGGGFIYDDILNLTWTQNANINGRAGWDEQLVWADGLSIYDAERSHSWDDWRLPSVDRDGDGVILGCWYETELACRDNELGYMYHHYGVTADAPGLFTGVQPDFYWSRTPDPRSYIAWGFNMGTGYRYDGGKRAENFAWAVRDGDVAVPILMPAINVQPNDDNNFVKTDGNFSDNMFVAIQGSAEFDATQVESATVKFGPAEASPQIIPGDVVDTNNDGIDDMQLEFRIADTGLGCDLVDAGVTLTGETNGGLIQFEGSDVVTTSECVEASCHP